MQSRMRDVNYHMIKLQLRGDLCVYSAAQREASPGDVRDWFTPGLLVSSGQES